MNQNIKEINPILMSQYNAMLNLNTPKSDNEIKLKIQKFNEAKSVEEAKKLLKQEFPDTEGKTMFVINGAEISVCETKEFFRVSADFSDEFISYNFNK